MKILYITNYDTMGGANLCLCEMAIYMKKYHNIEPYILVPAGGVIEEKLTPHGIKFICSDFRISAIDENTKYKSFRKLTRRIMRYPEYYKILNIIKRQGLTFDLVHTNTSITDIGLFLAQKWNIPHVWHFREFIKEHYPLEYIWSTKRITHKLLQSSKVISVSQALEQKVKDYSPKINEIQIYDGIDIRACYNKDYCKNDKVHFCIAGMITADKNQMDVVKACYKLITQGYHNFLLTIIGPTDDEYFNELINYVSENNLESYVNFTGFKEDVNSILEHMDVGIMASKKEAFGRVTIEYMANYMPVIGTRSGATPELIASLGLMYEVNNIDQLADKMIYCIDHIGEIKNLGLKARKISESFTITNNCEQIWNVYQEILKER